jgi:uncharacterized protein
MKLKSTLNTKRMILAPGAGSPGAAVSILRLGSRGYNRAVRGGLTTSKGSRLVLSACALWSLAGAQTAEPVWRQELTRRLVAAAIERTHHSVRYVSEYVRIPYPGGDVPADTGVCTDEIVRSYRAVGIDLQKEVHEDMVQNFAAYPNKRRWMLAHPDSNIDHRRVPNLMVFFQRKGESLPITDRAQDYAPGDLVTWDLGGNVPHIGIVVDRKAGSGRFMMVHNIGEGPKMEDVIFNWKITGHYRYYGPRG